MVSPGANEDEGSVGRWQACIQGSLLLPLHALCQGHWGAAWNEPGVRTDPVTLRGRYTLTWHPGGQVSAVALRGHQLCSVVNPAFLGFTSSQGCLQPWAPLCLSSLLCAHTGSLAHSRCLVSGYC